MLKNPKIFQKGKKIEKIYSIFAVNFIVDS